MQALSPCPGAWRRGPAAEQGGKRTPRHGGHSPPRIVSQSEKTLNLSLKLAGDRLPRARSPGALHAPSTAAPPATEGNSRSPGALLALGQIWAGDGQSGPFEEPAQSGSEASGICIASPAAPSFQNQGDGSSGLEGLRAWNLGVSASEPGTPNFWSQCPRIWDTVFCLTCLGSGSQVLRTLPPWGSQTGCRDPKKWNQWHPTPSGPDSAGGAEMAGCPQYPSRPQL